MTQSRLTAQEICDAALREFKTLPWTGSREGDRRRQMLVTFQVDPNELLLTIEEFTEKKIRPAMQELAKCVYSDVILLHCPELPKNINMAAASEYMRFVADTSWSSGQTMMRFDVAFELA